MESSGVLVMVTRDPPPTWEKLRELLEQLLRALDALGDRGGVQDFR